MSRGKAAQICLRKIERRALENLMTLLEDISQKHTKTFGGFIVKRRKVKKSDEVYHIPLLKLRAILLAADGKTNREIATQIEMSEHTVGRWRKEFIDILSRDDLPFDRIKGYFRYNHKPVENVILVLEKNENFSWWGNPYYSNSY